MKFVFEKIKIRVRRYLSISRRVHLGLALRHRSKGYELLRGNGLEIGALHNPAKISKDCQVEYADAMSAAEASTLFPELNSKEFVPVSIIVDLDLAGLSNIKDESYDFVVLNHVFEHVANPIFTIKELFRVVRPGGHIVVSAPDKNFTYDKPRKLTSFEHLYAEFLAHTTQVSDDHYYDLALAALNVKELEDSELLFKKMAWYRLRREHAHVWDSQSFKEFMRACQTLLGFKAQIQFESVGKDNRLENFSVWQKLM